MRDLVDHRPDPDRIGNLKDSKRTGPPPLMRRSTTSLGRWDDVPPRARGSRAGGRLCAFRAVTGRASRPSCGMTRPGTRWAHGTCGGPTDPPDGTDHLWPPPDSWPMRHARRGSWRNGSSRAGHGAPSRRVDRRPALAAWRGVRMADLSDPRRGPALHRSLGGGRTRTRAALALAAHPLAAHPLQVERRVDLDPVRRQASGRRLREPQRHPAPGQLLIYTGEISECEILFPYGACSFS